MVVVLQQPFYLFCVEQVGCCDVLRVFTGQLTCKTSNVSSSRSASKSLLRVTTLTPSSITTTLPAVSTPSSPWPTKPRPMYSSSTTSTGSHESYQQVASPPTLSSPSHRRTIVTFADQTKATALTHDVQPVSNFSERGCCLLHEAPFPVPTQLSENTGSFSLPLEQINRRNRLCPRFWPPTATTLQRGIQQRSIYFLLTTNALSGWWLLARLIHHAQCETELGEEVP